MTDYTKLVGEIGDLVTSKQQQYGDSVTKSGKILEILYPDGVQPHQYQDALLVVRILDKLSRIAQRGPDRQDLGGESPYRDIAGYGLLGASKDEQAKEMEPDPAASRRLWNSAYKAAKDGGHSEYASVQLANRVYQSAHE